MAVLDVVESMNFAKKFGVKFVDSLVVGKEAYLEKAVKKLRFPLVFKVISQEIVHKTDKGGIKLGISSLAEARKAFNELKTLAGFKGVLVQKMLKGKELIVGGKLDEQFGPTVLFGLGGIYVELLKDVSLRICPITAADADEMVKEIKGYKLLSGVRGEKAINFSELKKVLLAANKLMMSGKVKELDLNPVIADSRNVFAVDARIVK